MQGTSRKSSHVQWCQENQKTHGSHCFTVRIHNWSTRHRSEARQCSLALYGGFAMQLINHLIYVPLLPQRTYLGLQNYLAFACCMGCSSSLCPQQICQKYIPSPSLNTAILTTYYYHTAYKFFFPLISGVTTIGAGRAVAPPLFVVFDESKLWGIH